VLRYFNVVGADPKARVGPMPRPELGKWARVADACLDTAEGKRPRMEVNGVDYLTPDGSVVRDYVHVRDRSFDSYDTLPPSTVPPCHTVVTLSHLQTIHSRVAASDHLRLTSHRRALFLRTPSPIPIAPLFLSHPYSYLYESRRFS
jgi:hypothetical protein